MCESHIFATIMRDGMTVWMPGRLQQLELQAIHDRFLEFPLYCESL